LAGAPAGPGSLSHYRQIAASARQRPAAREVELFFRANDANYWAIAWIGKHISRRDYQALKSIVASIHLS
jgi:hypothetical protein